MGETLAGMIMGLIVGLWVGAVVGCSFGNFDGTRQTLETLKPCTKESQLMRQNIGDNVWICADGSWQKL